jgi:hypothetical protein
VSACQARRDPAKVVAGNDPAFAWPEIWSSLIDPV